MSRSYSLERCFSNACGQMMVSVPWSDSGSETGGFGRVLTLFFFKATKYRASKKNKVWGLRVI